MVDAVEMAMLADSASSVDVKYGIDLHKKIITCVLKTYDIGIYGTNILTPHLL